MVALPPFELCLVPVPHKNRVAALAIRLRFGGWRAVLHGDGRDESFSIYRSAVEPRLTCCKTIRRGGVSTTLFSLDIEAGHVTFPGGIDDSSPDLTTFLNIEAVAEFILTHDAAFAQEASGS